MTEPMKRVHFFDHQLLRAVDFTTEQEYHRALRHLHNRVLHHWGIADGLAVQVAGAARVSVTPGLAFDRNGREIVLDQAITLDLTPLDLPDGADCWVLAAWDEQASDPTVSGGVADHTRWMERAEISLSATAPADPGLALALGRVKRQGATATAVDGAERVDIGLPDAAELQAAFARKVDRQGATSMSGPLTVDTSLSAQDVTARGSLKVTGAVTVTGAATVGGAASVAGPLSVGTRQSRQRATVVGDLVLERGLIYAGRADGSNATANEVLGGIGFWGPGVQHGQLSFRAGTGFELVDRSSDGPGLDYPLGRYPYANLRVRSLYATSGITVGHGGSGALLVRQIDGKRTDGDGHDPLFLNYNTGHPVHIGGGAPAGLHVHGSITTDADVHFNGGGSVRSNGRVHVANDERLYLLPKGAVHVTRDWGGAGDVYAAGSIYAAGRGPGDRPPGHGEGIITWDLEALGGVYSPTKRFLIDHPLDPSRRHLVHACLEGPENGVYYRGEAVLSDGEVRIELPEYFEALTHDAGRTVLLTPKLSSTGAPVALLAASEVSGGAFTVRAAGGDPEQAFWWEIKGVRSDIDRLDVDLPKAGELVGAAGPKG